MDLEPEGTDDIVEVEAPEIPDEPKSRTGDVFQLGRHRLMCGDSTKSGDVSKLMSGATVDLIVTDPPYNVNYENRDRLIENDDMDRENFHYFLLRCFENAAEQLKTGGAFYVWYASRNVVEFSKALEEAELSVKQEIIWNKNSFTLGRQDYQWKHEPCLYGWKEGAAHYFINDRTQSTVIEDKIDVDKLKKEELKKLVEELLAQKENTTVIDEHKPLNNDLHPTMKPIRLLARLILNSSRKNEIVADFFGGSGSTLIACEQLDRRCFMMEYDPHYVDVIINRWEEYTGQKAIKIN